MTAAPPRWFGLSQRTSIASSRGGHEPQAASFGLECGKARPLEMHPDIKNAFMVHLTPRVHLRIYSANIH